MSGDPPAAARNGGVPNTHRIGVHRVRRIKSSLHTEQLQLSSARLLWIQTFRKVDTPLNWGCFFYSFTSWLLFRTFVSSVDVAEARPPTSCLQNKRLWWPDPFHATETRRYWKDLWSFCVISTQNYIIKPYKYIKSIFISMEIILRLFIFLIKWSVWKYSAWFWVPYVFLINFRSLTCIYCSMV